MLNTGDKVRIVNVGNVFDGKEGILEQVIQDDDSTMCTVFVDFLPEEGKKIRQNFDIANVEFLNEGKKDKKKKQSNQNNKGNNNTEQQPEEPKEFFDTSKLIPIDDERAFGKNINQFIGVQNCPFKIWCSSRFCNDLNEEKKFNDERLYTQFLKSLNYALQRMQINGFIKGSKNGSSPQNINCDGYQIIEMRLSIDGNNEMRILYAAKGILLFAHLIYKNTPEIPQQDKEIAKKVCDSCKKVVDKSKKQ